MHTIKLPRCFRRLTIYSPNEAMVPQPAVFNERAAWFLAQGDDAEPILPVHDDALVADGGAETFQYTVHAAASDSYSSSIWSPSMDDRHAPLVDDDDFVPADGGASQESGALEAVERGPDIVPADGGALLTGVWRHYKSMEAVDDDDAPLGDGEPRRRRRRLQRRNCEDPLNFVSAAEES